VAWCAQYFEELWWIYLTWHNNLVHICVHNSGMFECTRMGFLLFVVRMRRIMAHKEFHVQGGETHT
jgi:hypothetical protein